MKAKFFLFWKTFLQHELVNGSLYIFLGSIIGSLFSLFFNLFLARKLTYADYGTSATLISFLGLVTIPTQSITTVIVQYATNFFSRKEYTEAAYLYRKSFQAMCIVGSVVFLFFALFSQSLASFLHIETTGYILLTGLLAGVGYLSIVNTAFLQSLLKFGYISLLNFLGNIFKVIFGALLVIVGFKIWGVLFGLLFTGVLTIFISFLPLSFILTEKEEKITLSKKGILRYGILVGIITLSLSSFISTDIILVKHFFSPKDAGLYAGLSLIGRSIFYLTAPISMVLFPVIINRYNQGKNFTRTFYLALLLVATPSLCAVAFYFLFPQFTIQFFLGGKGYLLLTPYLWIFGLFITIFSLLNVCVTFFLSLKKTDIALPLSMGALLQALSIFLFHKSFFQVIGASLLICSILLLTILLYYLKSYGKKNTRKK